MLTQSGPICDVCGKYIMPINPDERVNFFSLQGCPRDLMCHNACVAPVKSAMQAKDWHLLPEGPLRKAFEDQSK